jgi:2'-5' RNA ligase
MTRTIIASLPEARAALEAARSSGAAAELESPPGAAVVYGVLWFAELNRALLAEFPDQPFTLTLDCGDRADLAHAALVEGIKRIRFNGHPDAARALQDIAQQVGAEFLPSERIFVIAEPEISGSDRDWIQSIRRQHDPQFDFVAPHFTLVFGAESALCAALVARAQDVATRVRAFAFDLQSAKVFSDAAAGHYVFLIPDLGSPELVSLHEALQVGPASDSPFVPHITVGRVTSLAEANAIAAALNDAKRVIRGHVCGLKVVAVAGRSARDLAAFELKTS